MSSARWIPLLLLAACTPSSPPDGKGVVDSAPGLIEDTAHTGTPTSTTEPTASTESALVAIPDAVDLVAPPGCRVAERVVIENPGPVRVRIEAVDLSGPDLIPSALPTPLVLEVGHRAEVDVSFTPTTGGPAAGELTVHHDGVGSPLRIPVSGEGLSDAPCAGPTVHPFPLVARVERVDVSLVLDTSCSMAGEVWDLKTTAEGLVASLVGVAPDATVGLATFEDYNHLGLGAGPDLPFRLVHPQTRDGAATVARRLGNVPLNGGADLLESAFEALFQVMTGLGYDQDCDGQVDPMDDVSPFRAGLGDAFAGQWPVLEHPTAAGPLGGMGHRERTPVVVALIGTGPIRDPSAGDEGPGGCLQDAGFDSVVDAFTARGARLLTVDTGSAPFSGADQRRALAAATGSFADLDGDGDEELAVVFASRADMPPAVVDGVAALLAAWRADRVAVVSDDPAVTVEPSVFEGVESGDLLDLVLVVDGTLVDAPTERSHPVRIALEADGQDVVVRTVHREP
ncbi:MAG: hypothetical protein ACI8PZ_002548 [Myxococcota bacterium]|jgi:hypothetical protein